MPGTLFVLAKGQPFSAAGAIVPGAQVFFYEAGTSTKVPIYTTSALSVEHMNPVEADGISGKLPAIWLDPGEGPIKYVVAPSTDTDPPSSPIDTVDDYIVPGSSAELDNPRTTAELAAGVTPADYDIPSHEKSGRVDARRYYSGTGTHTAALQAAIDVGAQLGAPGYLPAAMGEVTIDAALTITTGRAGLVGDGPGLSRILCDDCGAFSIASGLSFNTIAGMSIAQGVRHSTTPNTHVAIVISGTTASQCSYSTYRDLFIDGFHTAIEPNAVVQNLFENIRSVFCKNGFNSTGVSIQSTIRACALAGNAGEAGSFGLKLGAGVLDQEGWVVDGNTLFGFEIGIDALACLSSWFINNNLDDIYDTGIVSRSSVTAPALNNVSRNNYIGFNAAASASAGIQLANEHAASAAQNNGTEVSGNEILQYAGAGSLQYGILVEGDYDKKAIITANRCRDAATADIALEATATEAIVNSNQCYGAGYSIATGSNPSFSENNRGTVATATEPSVASAAALTLPTGPTVFTISGTTAITSIVATGHRGKIITLIFEASLTLTDGGNILLNGNTNLVTSSNDVVQFYCNGTNFIQVASASVN